MITILDNHLPPELTDMIYRMYHRDLMNQVREILTYKTVFYVYYDSSGEHLAFIICENQNYYSALDW